MVQDKDIWRIVRESKTLQEAAQQLISVARENGGEDNITVLIIGFEPDDTNQLVQNT
jgi:serine/threonine protein phosphatase PrpC